jgi:CBS domain-containing protein
MTTVQNILESKGAAVWTVEPDTLVFDALTLMAEKNIGALLVTKDNALVGIFSERDYARKIVLKGGASHTAAVKEIMTQGVISVGPDQSIDECMEIMTGKHVRHLPVFENNKLIGMVSIGDIVKAMVSEREHTIEQLKNYITGTR